MTQNPSANDWLNARGAKWLEHLTGMEATLAPIDEPVIRALALDGPVRIAEIGCGGGATAAAILQAAPSGSVVHGYDLVPRLVEEARHRYATAGLTFGVADMGHASPEAPYDRLVSRLGIMFFDEPERAFSNLARWLKPGGRFAFAVWAPPRDNSWLAVAREAVATVVDVPMPDPNGPGPYRYADASILTGLLERTGFTNVSVETWRGLLPIGGAMAPNEAARFALASFSSFSELLTPGGAPAFEKVLEILIDERHDFTTLPRCPTCNALQRPHIVWFGEIPFEMHWIKRRVQAADVFITVGSSGVVYPAAGLVREIVYRKQNGEVCTSVYVGLERPDNANEFDRIVLGKAGEVLPALLGVR